MPYRQNFPIPAVIDPPKQCLCIEIPNHPDWKAVIAGTLGELRYWYNWERTGDTSGAQCAAVWKEVFDSIDWSVMSCCCDSTNPPQYQYSVDGVLQVSVDGGVTYTDSPNADVRNNSPKFPPIPGDDGDDKKCAAATGAANLVKEQVGDQLTDDMGRYTLSQLIADWTHTVIDTSNPFTALVTVVANQIFALVISSLIAALTEDVYHLFACALYCNMADDGSFDDAQWESARAKILSSISGIAGVFLEHLVYLLGKVGTTNIVRSAPDDTGDCSDCCALCDTTNFDITIFAGNPVGTLIGRGAGYIDIETASAVGFGGGWFAQITTTDADICCTFTYMEKLSGADEILTSGLLCGEPLWPTTEVHGFSAPQDINTFRVATPVGSSGIFRVHFG